MDETDIVQLSKDFLAAQMDDLVGNEDPKAFQLLKSSDGVLGVSLVDIPPTDEEKDLMADYLAAACCVHQAVEATFASSAWSAMYSDPASTREAPRDRANRVEIVMLAHVTRERIETHTASILRVDGKVRLSPWLSENLLGSSIYSAGRIPEALKLGIGLTTNMPEELVKALVEARELFPPGRLVEMFVKQIREVRDQVRQAAQCN